MLFAEPASVPKNRSGSRYGMLYAGNCGETVTGCLSVCATCRLLAIRPIRNRPEFCPAGCRDDFLCRKSGRFPLCRFLKNSVSKRAPGLLFALPRSFFAEAVRMLRYFFEKVKKYVKNLWGGGIFFIYLRRETNVKKPIPDVPRGNIHGSSGSDSASAKGRFSRGFRSVNI